MTRSAKVIAFPVRPTFDPAASRRCDDGPTTGRAPVSKLKLWLVCLLAPLILIGSLVLFLAVVGVWLVWLAIVTLLVASLILFARRLLRRYPPIFGFRHRATSSGSSREPA